MSGSFVRASKFRHVFGEEYKTEQCYTDIKASTVGEGTYIAANTEFFAVAKQGGGGPVIIQRFDQPGRLSINHPTLNVHRAKVLDMAFHPFIGNMIATGGEDCAVKVSQFPSTGLTEHVTEAAVTCKGHTKKVMFVKFNPTANSVLSSASFDRTIKLWDIEKQAEMLSYGDFGDMIQSYEFSDDGSQIFASCKDKKVRLYDPRQAEAVQIADSFSGTKSARVFHCGAQNLVGAVGFTRTSQRRIKFWDPRNLSGGPVRTVDLDQSASVLLPFYDNDLSILYLAGKGGGDIRYFEVDSTGVYHLANFRSSTPQKGLTWIPKRACDTTHCEIARFLRLTRDTVAPVSMRVPRKTGADIFQDDIFPDTYAGVPSMTAEEYFGGASKEVIKTSLDPEKRTDGAGASAAATFVAKKSYEQLEEELAAAQAKIAELEAKLAGQ
ncbi:MAG: hypothetical protein MHM6MM_002464 [Cercozoa sp. M6MM]